MFNHQNLGPPRKFSCDDLQSLVPPSPQRIGWCSRACASSVQDVEAHWRRWNLAHDAHGGSGHPKKHGRISKNYSHLCTILCTWSAKGLWEPPLTWSTTQVLPCVGRTEPVFKGSLGPRCTHGALFGALMWHLNLPKKEKMWTEIMITSGCAASKQDQQA